MGGTGKTPMVEYLTELLLKNQISVAILSRGYKRKTSGYIMASASTTSKEIGDEPYQLKRKFEKALVAVCENRVTGIKKLIESGNKPDVIILDDAFQHRSVSAGLNILLTDYHKPYFKDWILPSGNLRESASNMKRADIFVVTKSPVDISEYSKKEFQEKINPAKSQTLYFAHIEYEKLKPFLTSIGIDFNDSNSPEYSVLLFTGISNPDPLINYLKPKFKELFSIKFADHYNYALKDFDKINQQFRDISNSKKILITTEKDIARIEKTETAEHFKKIPLYCVPIKISFNKQEDIFTFDNKILNYVGEDSRNL